MTAKRPASGTKLPGENDIAPPQQPNLTNNTALGVSGTETFSVAIVNSKHAVIAQLDGGATSAAPWTCSPVVVRWAGLNRRPAHGFRQATSHRDAWRHHSDALEVRGTGRTRTRARRRMAPTPERTPRRMERAGNDVVRRRQRLLLRRQSKSPQARRYHSGNPHSKPHAASRCFHSVLNTKFVRADSVMSADPSPAAVSFRGW
jgi:hypothetical protein